MTKENTKRYMELQMQELKSSLDTEEDVRCFEEELEIVNSSKLGNIATSLIEKFPNEERDYAHELDVVLEAGWKQLVETAGTHPKEQLTLIQETEFDKVVEALNAAYPDYDGDFESEIRAILAKRWETIISIKKEHVKEEFTHIKTLGLKPNYAKRIYKQYHGID